MLSIAILCCLTEVAVGLPLNDTSVANNTATIATPGHGPRLTTTTSWWHVKPDQRGTFDLLLSFFTTLAFAAWTSYHPNIPIKGPMVMTRLKWITFAAIAPEVVLACAVPQWWAARRLKAEINRLGATSHRNVGRETAATKTIPRTITTWPKADSYGNKSLLGHNNAGQFQPWTLKEAFFAISGGFAVESSEYFPLGSLTFTAKGIQCLAKAGRLPVVSPRTIEDKSNADWFAKTLACIQGGTFAATCIGRWIQHLPVTLLELHVLIHVACALLLYLIWFKKGYDVTTPIYLDDEGIHDLAAFFALQPSYVQERFNRERQKHLYAPRVPDTSRCTHQEQTGIRLEHVRCAQTCPMEVVASWRHQCFQTLGYMAKLPPIDPFKAAQQLQRAERAVALLRESEIHIHCKEVSEAADRPESLKGMRGLGFPRGPYVVPRSSNTLVEGALRLDEIFDVRSTYGKVPPAFQKCPWGLPDQSDTTSSIPGLERTTSNTSLFSRSDTALRKHCARYYGHFDSYIAALGALEWTKSLLHLNLLGLWLVTASYGGAHLAAWNYNFATVAETWLWRSTCLFMIVVPALFPIAAAFKTSAMEYEPDLWGNDSDSDISDGGVHRPRDWKETFGRLGYHVWKLVSLTVAVIAGHYVWMRLMLLSLALAALGKIEPGTYDTVRWAQYLPSFG